MKEISKELLESLGFESNHPDYPLAKYYKRGIKPEWHIGFEPSYIPLTNTLSYMVNCWKCNERGAIVKRGSLSYINDFDDAERLFDLCEIEWNDCKADDEFVDLGLSVKWATCNIGASSPHEYGNYYMWDSIAEGGGQKFTNSEYNRLTLNEITDNLTNEHDVVYQATNGVGRIPTIDECRELMDKDKITHTVTTRNGVDGMLFTSKVNGYEGNSLFIPFSGYRNGLSIRNDGNYAVLWSSSAFDDTDAYYLYYFSDGSCDVGSSSRCYGYGVRAVQNKNENDMDKKKEHEFVDLGLSAKWATCNIGATTPHEYGNYYMWGSTTPNNGTDYSRTTYNELGLNSIESNLTNEHDVAYQTTNGVGRMPTADEFRELLDEEKIIHTVTARNGVDGMLFTSKVKGYEGNSIFIPFNGFRVGSSLFGGVNAMYLWSSSVDSDTNACYLGCNFSGDCGVYDINSYCGQGVRAVQSKN